MYVSRWDRDGGAGKWGRDTAEQLCNHRGELVFARHPAQKLLHQDIEEKKHKKMTPSQLHASLPEYKAFKLNVFTQRISQEVRQIKFVNYLE